MTAKKILIVDDEQSILNLFSTALRQKGYHVFGAPTAEDASHIPDNESISVMFLDLNLPGMDGIQLCKTILKTNPDAIIFAVSGYTSKEKALECKKAGFEAYFSKPLPLQELYKASEAAFDRLEKAS